LIGFSVTDSSGWSEFSVIFFFFFGDVFVLFLVTALGLVVVDPALHLYGVSHVYYVLACADIFGPTRLAALK